MGDTKYWFWSIEPVGGLNLCIYVYKDGWSSHSVWDCKKNMENETRESYFCCQETLHGL